MHVQNCADQGIPFSSTSSSHKESLASITAKRQGHQETSEGNTSIGTILGRIV